MLQIRETIYGQKSGWACNSSGGMRVPACQGTLKAVNHIAPNIQSAMPAKTTAPQFNRIVFAPPEYARARLPRHSEGGKPYCSQYPVRNARQNHGAPIQSHRFRAS